MTDSEIRAPKVFVSYSWDDKDHRNWVREFATRLREHGVDAKLDQWEVQSGDPQPEFMERSVRENDFALVVCTPKYKARSDSRIGGVGYEGDIMIAEVLTQRNHRKFKPVLRRGDWSNAFPSWLSGKNGIDLRGDPYDEEEYTRLLAELYGRAPKAPPLGSPPASIASMPGDLDPSAPDIRDVSDHHDSDSSIDPAKLEGARRQLGDLPVEDIPVRSGLPSGSVMRLRPNPHFVGRHEDLKRIATNLKDGGTTAIGEVTVAASSGLGGVGKTQLACEFVYRYGRFFHGVYWINFGEPVEIPAEVAFCGGPQGMNLRPYKYHELSVRERVQVVMSEWESDLPRLLVFDNCEDEELLEQWLPSGGGCRVLVTSRRESWASPLGVKDVKLDVLEREGSVALLREYRPDLPADSPELNAIAEELGHLPLALDLAGRYLEKYRREVTPAEYLEDIQRPEILEHPSLREARGLSPTKHDMDVWRTFAVSYWRLDAEDETDRTAVKLLARAARLSVGEPIPDSLLAWTLKDPEDDDVAPPEPSTTVRDALDRLTDLGLLGKSGEGDLTMHRLVAAFALAEADDHEAQAAVEVACGRAAGRAYRRGRPAEQEALLPHVRSVTNSAEGRGDAMAANLCTALNLSLQQLGLYDEALRYAHRAWEISAALYGPEARATLQRRSNVGEILEGKGDRAQAKSIYEKVLEAQERCFGPDDPDVAATLNNIGASFSRDDLYHETMSAYRRALRIREDVWERTPEDDPDRTENADELAEGHGNMGELLMDLARHGEAAYHLTSALEVLSDEVELSHERNASTLVTLGRAFRALGDHSDATSSIDSALGLYREIGMAYSNTSARALANVGATFKEWAEEDSTLPIPQRATILEQARGSLQVALDGAEEMYGEDHPITGGILQALAEVCAAQGDAESDGRYRERAEASRRANFDSEDANVASTLNLYGTILTRQGLYDEAQSYLERALDIRENTLGEEDFDTSTSLFKLGILLQLRGRDEEAREYLERALTVRSGLCGEGHAATEIVRENLRLLNG